MITTRQDGDKILRVNGPAFWVLIRDNRVYSVNKLSGDKLEIRYQLTREDYFVENGLEWSAYEPYIY